MKIINKILYLPEGTFNADVAEYESRDKVRLYKIYKSWRILCIRCNKLLLRAVNLPEGLSEAAFCLEMNSVKLVRSISGANSSFDCYNLEEKRRIQVKAASVIPDLTSFGPRSVWDDLYFLNFYKNGKWDGTFDIYLIDSNLIYNCQVNMRETFRDQQDQGRRPRLSIFNELIKKKNLKPIKTGSLRY